MIATRKLLLFMIAMLLAMFATPGFADGEGEKFSVRVLGPSEGQFTAAFKNEGSEDDNAIKSLQLTAPPGVTFGATPTLVPSASGITGEGTSVVLSEDHRSVSVKYVRIRNQQTLTLKFPATLPSNNACAGTSLTWTAKAWDGSSLNGDQFRLNTETSSLVTTVPAANCTLSFATPPANTLGGAIITGAPFNNPAGLFVKVQLKVNGNNVTDNSFNSTKVKVASSCLATGSTKEVFVVNGVATFSNLIAVSGPASCAMTASATNFTFVPGPAAFNITVPNAMTACGANIPTTATNPQGLPSNAPGYAAGTRGTYNKDGNTGSATCVTVESTFSNNIQNGEGSTNSISHIWDTTATGQASAAFSYTVNWKREDINTSTGWPNDRHPRVAWKVDSFGTPVYILGQTCTSQSLPAPYGTLTAAITASTNPISVSAPGTLPPRPFAIVIGSERMVVTTVVGSSWTLAGRGDGGTTAAAHPSGAQVMSTPMPLLTSAAINATEGASSFYMAGNAAQMCIWDHGWMSVGQNPSTGIPQVIYSTSVFDIGDGFMDGGD